MQLIILFTQIDGFKAYKFNLKIMSYTENCMLSWIIGSIKIFLYPSKIMFSLHSGKIKNYIKLSSG